MAYQIVKSDGQVLAVIPDGTINTSNCSVGLPGRNYAGYGQVLDTNFVQMLENFADSVPPANPLRGQLWYNTNNDQLYVCPVDGETNVNNWLLLTSTASGGSTSFAAITVSGNIECGNIDVAANLSAVNGTFTDLEVTGNTTLNNLGVSGSCNIATVRTTGLTTGANSTPGTAVGTWTFTGTVSGNAIIANGNIAIGTSNPAWGIKTDNYYYANGVAVSFAGTYTNANVAAYLPTYVGNVGTGATVFVGTTLTTGANITQGTITGNWTLSSGSRLLATYADLAERFEADNPYAPGTVVELGGDKEITAVKYELSEDVFGVISDSAAYLMNAGAGSDDTHPAVAVSGRVRVKVTGLVRKGKRLVSAGEGIAREATDGEATAFNTIGRALEDKTTNGFGYVEAIVMIR
jgi:hypothetical protein